MESLKKILITGGAGFIGVNLIKLILREYPDYHVVNYDLLTYAGNLVSLADIENDPRYTFVKGDVSDSDAVNAAMDGCWGVLHLAAESHVDRSILDATPFLNTNVIGTMVMLEATRKHGIERYIQISTDEVYGSLKPEDPAFTETNRLFPNSPYSASKAGADLLVRSYFKTYDLPVIITRCSNNYGPYMFPEKLIPLLINNALHDKPIPVYGDGRQIRDWLYVEDHCRAIMTTLENGQPGEMYNIGGNNEIMNIDLVKTLLRELNKPESLIEFVKDRPGHDRRYAIDSSKIKNELGWEPQYKLEDAMQKTVTWYLNNKEWIDSVISGEYMEYYSKQYGN
ncbi:MAG: dTDP-glucose 4,6-dehydratase [Calditrichaeota bacterium]|nr:dTDP-glucose 4,6-dehydratase [Calditrichota bacterium]